MNSIGFRAICVLLSFCIAIPALAAERTPAQPLWQLDPVEGFAGRQFSANETIAKVRMLPHRMLELDSDFLQDNGRVAAPKGTQLIALESSVAIACAIFPPKLSAGAAIFALGADRHLCIIDQDRNGSFDHYYFRQTDEAGFYNLHEFVSNKLKPGTGGAYGKRESNQMRDSLVWTLQFNRCVEKGKRAGNPRRICLIDFSLGVDGFGGTSMGSRWVTYGRVLEFDLTDTFATLDFFGLALKFEASGGSEIAVSLAQDPSNKPFLLY